jgi:hypothetical protein
LACHRPALARLTERGSIPGCQEMIGALAPHGKG